MTFLVTAVTGEFAHRVKQAIGASGASCNTPVFPHAYITKLV